MLYETAAHAGEILALNVENLDLPRKRAVIIGKGGHKEYVFLGVRRCSASLPIPNRTPAKTGVPDPPATERDPCPGGRMPTHGSGKTVLCTTLQHSNKQVVGDASPTTPLLTDPPRRSRSLHHLVAGKKSAPRSTHTCHLYPTPN